MELHQVSHQNLLSEIKASPLANKPAGRFHFSPGFARLLKTSGNFDMNAKKNATQFSCLPQNELNEGQDKQTSTVSARSTCAQLPPLTWGQGDQVPEEAAKSMRSWTCGG